MIELDNKGLAMPAHQSVKPKVLVLDDEVEIAELLEVFLSDDFSVTTVNDPRIACELIKSLTFDLIVSDIMMPYMTGLEFLQFSKKICPSVPIVLITGHAQSYSDAKSASDLGASGVLPKPFGEPKELVSYFQKILASTKNSDISSKQKILAIDDEQDLLEVLSVILEDSFEVECLSDPQKVEETLSHSAFSAIFCDLNMPKFSGVKVIEKIKNLAPMTPVFIMSGHSAHDEQVKKGIEAGAVDIVPKPFPDGPELLSLIRKYVK